MGQSSPDIMGPVWSPYVLEEVGTAIEQALDIYLFGVETCLFLACIFALWQLKARSRMTQFNFILISFLWIVGVVNIGYDATYWVLSLKRNDDHINTWVGEMGPLRASLSVAALWLGDGLMFYRAFLTWDGRRFVLALGVPLYIAAILTGVLHIVLSWGAALPLPIWLYDYSAATAIVFNGILALQNVMFTSLIVARLVSHARSQKAILGEEYGRPYEIIVSILVESAAPLTAANTAMALAYAWPTYSASFAFSIFSSFQTNFACISPQLIVLRVALGRSWSQNMTTSLAKSVATSGSSEESPEQRNSTPPVSMAVK